jgi:phage-related protein
MATELGVAYLSLLPEMRGFRPAAEKGMDKVGKGVATRFGVGFHGAIGSIVSRSAGIFAAGFASVKVGGFLKDAIGQASDLGETTSKVGQIFGPAAKEILAFSKTSSTALGQTQQAALDANATFGIFGKAAGLQGKELSGFTTNLTTLASDLASFNNTSPEQAIEAIGAALRGETEPMRAYGVLLDDASLRQEALSQGLIKTTKQALTPQQKVLSAQALIMKQTTTAQGDFARTSGGLANQQRILSARFSDFKTSIGAVALPLVTRLFGFLNDKAVPVLGEIRGGIVAFGAAFKANDGDITSSGFPGFMERVGFIAAQAFGIFKSQVLPRLKEFAGFVSANAVPAIQNLIAAFTPLAKDVGAAAVSVFQKLGPAVFALGAPFVALLPALKSFTGFLKDNKTLVGSVAVGVGAMVLAFQAYHLTLAIVSGITKAYAAVQTALNVVMSANPIALVVLALVGLAAGLVYAYKHSEKFRDVVNGVFGAVKGVVLGVVDGLTNAFHAVTGAIGSVIDFVKNNWKTILPLILGPILGIPLAIALHWDKIKAVFFAGVAAVLGGLKAAWGAIVGVMSGPVSAVVNVLQAIWSRVYPIIALPFFIAKALIENFWRGVQVVFTAAAGWVSTVFSKAWGLVQSYIVAPLNVAWGLAKVAWGAIMAAFTAAKNWVVSVFSKAWAAVKGTLSGPLNAAKNEISTRWQNIQDRFTAAKNWVTGTFAKAWDALKAKITGPVTSARDAVTSILSGTKGGLQWVFTQAVSGIGRIWDGLQEVAKRPIRFIVNTVLNDGLIGAFNWVAGKFQAPTIPTISLPKGFASGGKFDGRLPGRPSSVDNMLGMSAAGPVGLATGEFITNARDTARALPLLRHINNGGDLPGFANGGLFGKMKDSITGAFNAGKSFGQDALGFLSDPVKWFKERLSGPLNRMSELGNSPYAEVVKAVPRNLVNTVSAKAKDLLGFGGGAGGPINPGLGGALNWARSQVGKPYIWGGVGPGGYDCSGFMSAIVNVIRGSNPFQRLFATGSLPAGMFAPGPGAFELGWFTGNPGHVAGTLNGVDVESRGGAGVKVGPGARGAHDSLFNRHGHLVGYANGGIIGDPPFDLLDPRGKAYTGKAVMPRSALSFDSGGMLPTGYSMVHNGTGKPEPVGHDFLRKDDLNGMRFVLDAGGVGELTGYVQVTAQSEIKESNRAVRRKVGR